MRVEQVRGSLVEAVHAVHAAVVDTHGRLVAHTGDRDLVTFWRSAAKPFQALPLVEDRLTDRFGFTSEELALVCASHSSEAAQVARVRELLGKIGCSERDLLCGPHAPLSERVAQDYATRGLRLTAVYSNCSGKHAGMLALARHHGWPTEFYTRSEHPVQQRCLHEVSRWTDVPVAGVRTATDGCGVVCCGIALRNMALAYARLANAEVGTRNAPSAFRVVEAMLRHPDLIAGEGRPCTEMMRAHHLRAGTAFAGDEVGMAEHGFDNPERGRRVARSDFRVRQSRIRQRHVSQRDPTAHHPAPIGRRTDAGHRDVRPTGDLA